MSAQGVYTTDYRFEFVSGWLTGGTDPEDGSYECGDGTAFPMECTLDQLAEIHHRVKDAWFTGGSVSWTVMGSPATFSAPTSAPSNRAAQIDDSTLQYRGYTKVGVDDYNGAEYDAGYGVEYSDIADNERGIFREHYLNKNAFSYFQDDPNNIQGGDSQWWGISGLGAKSEVIFGGKVAVIKADPSHADYAAGNRYFIELRMYYFDYNTVLGFGGGINLNDPVFGGDWSATSYHICNYVIRLASGDISCPFYFYTVGSTAPYDGEDIIHEAKVWFPQAKNSPPTAVWNTATGAKL